ncbi:MAG: DUF2911 domain-containing protein [Saprospiraceae bacterium]|nr:DUF2911 domain-containing protein [Saprospiraceae bacterium]
MKKISYSVILASFLVSSCANQTTTPSDYDHSAHIAPSQENKSNPSDTKPASPHQTAMANIGDTHVHVDYSAPSVRNRIIWNGLVAYDQVWVTGAHRATSINFSNDVTINGKKIAKGEYAFFTIPNKDEWTLILNKNYEQHLADDYDQNLDVIRIKVKPEILDQPVEILSYEVKSGEGGNGAITVSWGKSESYTAHHYPKLEVSRTAFI